MKSYSAILLGLLLISISCSTPGRGPASVNGPTHHIFLIHGITGDQTHFGHMKTSLSAQLARLSPGIRYVIQPFEYDTKSDSKDVSVFADDLNAALNLHFKNEPLREGDRVSIVAHSQGGIVSSIWLFRAFLGYPGYDKRIAEKVDAFITLGTPFWGSKLATFVNGYLRVGSKLGMNLDPVGIYGDKQLLDMSFNSPVVYDFRKNLTDPRSTAVLAEMKKGIRALNVAGIVKSFSKVKFLNFMKHFSIGKEHYEDDMAVPLPSARLDYIFASLPGGYSEGQTESAERFGETSFAGFEVVDGVHFLPPPLNKNVKTICQVPENCASDLDCDHPTFKMVIHHLLGLPQEPAPLTREMTSFMIDLILHTSDGSVLQEKDVKVSKKTPRKVKLGDWSEFYNGGVARVKLTEASKTGPLRAFYTGYAEDTIQNGAFEKRLIEFKIEAKGFKTRTITVPVKATYTTFADVVLDRK